MFKKSKVMSFCFSIGLPLQEILPRLSKKSSFFYDNSTDFSVNFFKRYYEKIMLVIGIVGHDNSVCNFDVITDHCIVWGKTE